MRALSLIHRWAGGFIGLLLALLGLTGSILVWEGEWIALPGAGDPIIEDAARIGMITERAAAEGTLARITFASEETALHQLTYADGSGAYVRQDGAVVDRWASQWERPELWLFDLHHHLFAGDTGELITGLVGIAGLLFALTGAVLWWRSRKAFKLRLWPSRFAPGPIVAHHRDLGIVMLPLLLVSMLSGVLMLFDPLRHALLGQELRPKATAEIRADPTPAEAVSLAKALFPDARLRRISLPAKPADPIVVRLRQPFEWTPNGRTQVSLAADGKVAIEDARLANSAARLAEKAYPAHSAKVGGITWKLAMSASGLALGLLGALATYSFWFRKGAKRRRRQNRAHAGRPASALPELLPARR